MKTILLGLFLALSVGGVATAATLCCTGVEPCCDMPMPCCD